MPAAMSNTNKSFFSGGYAEKIDEKHLAPHEIYCESQNVTDNVAKEEQVKEVEVKENKKKRFIANYNTFF